ncbi:MAG: DNA recombination protein RmuC [[Clostridium] fimetarium]|nr:DNA recombination protein RmuC [Alistipes timonensis]MCM1406601.1 DNA recombination protein RmuC [[Clostridium] fimetarium]
MVEAREAAAKQLSDERAAANTRLSETCAEYERRLLALKADADKQLAEARDAAIRQIMSEREHQEALRTEADKQWKSQLEKLREEMRNAAAELLQARQAALQESNREQMGEILKPIKEQFAEFKRTVEESRTASEVGRKEIRNTFDASMKLFQQQQEQAVKLMREQTDKIGQDAANLTKALKGDSKMQGDWGEMILESVLANSGLRRDEEYFIQEVTPDEEGRNLRPDVIVKFPEGRSVVIDSKVSLTAYAAATEAPTDELAQRMLSEHVRSVRKHIDELAEKRYDKTVKDAIGYVLMFMPIENSYMVAMKKQPDLSRYAYQKGIILISPSNLMMALQLAFNLWQQDRQGKNVEKIVKTATELYEKLSLFSDTFADVEGQIERLQKTFSKAKDQLYEGKGNVMRRMEGLKSLGITPKRQIKGLEE